MQFLFERSSTDPDCRVIRRAFRCDGETDPVVTIPEEFGEIGPRAFADHQDIEEVRIPASVRFVGKEAFKNCRNLKRVIVAGCIAEYGIEFGPEVFTGCEKLTDSDGFVFLQAGTDRVLCEYYGPGGVVHVPDGTTALIGSGFSYRKDIEKVVLPESVRLISQSFNYCTGLREICIPDSAAVAPDSFKGCRRLADENGFLIVGDTLFGYFGQDRHISIPNGVRTIGSHAFKFLDAPETVAIPGSVTDICDEAFYRCIHLRSVSVPDSVLRIGTQPFYECSAMADENGFVILRDRLIRYYGRADEPVIPDGITVIDDSAFEDAISIEKITLPPNLKRIGSSAFRYCDSLTSIDIPEGVEVIPDYAFDCCHSLEKVKLPKSLRHIGYRAFQYCDSLVSLVIPDKVESIRNFAFRGSTLESVWIRSGVCEIICDPFYECDRLERVIIQPKVLAHSGDRDLWAAAVPYLIPEELAGIIDACPIPAIRKAFREAYDRDEYHS